MINLLGQYRPNSTYAMVADRFEADSKLVADLQRAEIWTII